MRTNRSFHVLMGAIAALVSLSAASADDSEAKKPAELLAAKSVSSIPRRAGQGAEFYVRLRLRAAKVESKRQPISLAVVFDRSGSMKEEGKIEFAKKGGHLVADNLTRTDFVAMVAYNHEVQTLVPMHPVVNREYLHHRIDELHPEGYTNISGGLLEGCAEVRKRLDQAGLHHVILLTDGLANRGVTDVDSLVELTRRCNQRGVTVSTIGLGTEYNEDLLSRMSQAGGGRYHYVAKGEDLPKAFKRELGALLESVVQNARLKITLPEGIELAASFGREVVHTPEMPKNEREIRLGDFSSGDEQGVLLKFKQTASQDDHFDLPMTIRYDDVLAAERVKLDSTVTVHDHADADDADAKNVSAYAELVEGLETIALAVSSMDRKVAAEALDIRERRYASLKKTAWASRDQDFVNKAFMFEHYARELAELIDHGALHEHSAERAKLQKDLHYKRYLMNHHHDHKH